MLYYLIATLYILSCLVLLMVVLLQQGKGGDIASAFGGSSSQTAFGARISSPTAAKAQDRPKANTTTRMTATRMPGSPASGR